MQRAIVFRALIALSLLGAGACSRTMGCSGCGGMMLAPIPGGFDATAEIDRAAQVRLTARGLSFVDANFQDIMSAYSGLRCGPSEPVPCPGGFLRLPQGTPNPSTCDAGRMICIEQATGRPGPLFGFEIPRTDASGATVCRDDPADPRRRSCHVWLRMESLHLVPRAPNQVVANLTTQIRSNDIPIHYAPVNMNCVVSIDTSSNPNHLQPLSITAHFGEWTPPSGSGGRQLQIAIDQVDAQIPDGAVHIARDPVHGGIGDLILCGIANLGPVKAALVGQLTSRMRDLVRTEVDKGLGWKCRGPGTEPCPAATTCNSGGLCEENANHQVVPGKFGIEGRMYFSRLLAGLTGGRQGEGDLSFVIGGHSATDATGLQIGALGGAEVVRPDPTCATVLASPRLRPGWVAPPPLPTAELADLDFDGVPETPYMLAAGFSQDLLAQYMWTIYTSGLFCQSISSQQIELLNTGTLELVAGSIKYLTHHDLYPQAIFPARITLRPRAEPTITIGSGKVEQSMGMSRLVEPLINLTIPDLEIGFFGLIEERWVRLMTATLDLKIGVGVVAVPGPAIEPVLGDLHQAISNIRIKNYEILEEDQMTLEENIPAILDLALPRLTGALPRVALPSGRDLGGFTLRVLGIRGIEGSPGVYPNLAVYADLAFDPALAGALQVAAETEARVVEVKFPPPVESEARAARAARAPAEVILELGGRAPSGQKLEYQLRVNEGFWTPFFFSDGPTFALTRPEFVFQGHHSIEVRARIAGQYESLDPSPVKLDVVIDSEPPSLKVRLAEAEGGVYVEAFDFVSRDRVRIELGVDRVWREVSLGAGGFVAVPELADPRVEIKVAAIDEQGLRAEALVRSRLSEGAARGAEQGTGSGGAGGCRCVTTRAGGIGGVWGAGGAGGGAGAGGAAGAGADASGPRPSGAGAGVAIFLALGGASLLGRRVVRFARGAHR